MKTAIRDFAVEEQYIPIVELIVFITNRAHSQFSLIIKKQLNDW